jgi:hypothetical protein
MLSITQTTPNGRKAPAPSAPASGDDDEEKESNVAPPSSNLSIRNETSSLSKKKLFGSNYNIYQQQAHDTLLNINNNLERYIKPRQQLIFMLMWVVVIFYVCVFPVKLWWIFLIVMGKSLNIRLREFWYIQITLRILFYTNCSINPILYNCLSKKFRNSFRRILGRCGCKSGTAANNGGGGTTIDEDGNTTTINKTNNTVHYNTASDTSTSLSDKRNRLDAKNVFVNKNRNELKMNSTIHESIKLKSLNK